MSKVFVEGQSPGLVDAMLDPGNNKDTADVVTLVRDNQAFTIRVSEIDYIVCSCFEALGT